MPMNPHAFTACLQPSCDVSVCVLSVCVQFFVCLVRLASSSPCQQFVVFLLAGLTLRHVKRATGKKRQVNSRFPWTGPQYWERFGCQTINFTFSTIKTKKPPPLSQNQPTTDLFLHVTAVKVFHLKASFKKIRYYYLLLLLLLLLFVFFSFGFCLCIFGYSKIYTYNYRRDNSRHFVVCDMYKHVTLNTMLHFKRWPIKSFPNCCRCAERLLLKTAAHRRRWGCGGVGERRALLMEKFRSGFLTQTHTLADKNHTHTNTWTQTGVLVAVQRQDAVRVVRLREVISFFFFCYFHPPFSFMDSLLLSRMTLNRAYSNPFRP